MPLFDVLVSVASGKHRFSDITWDTTVPASENLSGAVVINATGKTHSETHKHKPPEKHEHHSSSHHSSHHQKHHGAKKKSGSPARKEKSPPPPPPPPPPPATGPIPAGGTYYVINGDKYTSLGPAISANPWSGYVLEQNGGEPFTSIQATWVLPADSATNQIPQDYYMWVGLGGMGSTATLLQDGLGGANTDDPVVYDPWAVNFNTPGYTWSSANFFENELQAQPGDQITAITQAVPDGSGQYSMNYTIRNDTTGQAYQVPPTTVSNPDLATAEVILEDTGGPHTNSGQIPFTNILVNGTPMGTQPNTVLQPIALNQPLGTPSNFTVTPGGGQFTVYWQPGTSQRTSS